MTNKGDSRRKPYELKLRRQWLAIEFHYHLRHAVATFLDLIRSLWGGR